MRLKRANLEFEVKGSEDFIERMYTKFTDFLEEHYMSEEIAVCEEDTDAAEEESEDLDLTPNSAETPLDVYLSNLNAKTPQQKCVAIALYLKEVKGIDNFQSGDINKVLKENKLSPLKNVTKEVTRIRDKGIFSLVPGGGARSFFTIYNDAIDTAKEFVQKST